jgi:hypothetical protein
MRRPGDCGDPGPAPSARRPGTAAAMSPAAELGRPRTARGPARRNTQSAAPGPAAAGYPGHDPALAPRHRPPPLGRQVRACQDWPASDPPEHQGSDPATVGRLQAAGCRPVAAPPGAVEAGPGRAAVLVGSRGPFDPRVCATASFPACRGVGSCAPPPPLFAANGVGTGSLYSPPAASESIARNSTTGMRNGQPEAHGRGFVVDDDNHGHCPD